MKAQRIHSWGGELALEDVAEPVPGNGEVLVDVEACGVGLTVLNYIRGDLGDDASQLPRTPGHEVVGRIVATGPEVDSRRIGERIVAYFYLFCGRCQHCLAGEENLCDNLAGFLGVNRDGGYAEKLTLPEHNAIPCGDEMDAVAATVVPDAVATSVHVARRASIGSGQRVAVIGAGGGIGMHMVQVARLRGAEVTGLDLPGSKLIYLEKELRIPGVDSSDFSRVRLAPSWSGRADVIVDLLGTAESTAWALSALSPGGRLALLTTFHDTSFNTTHRNVVLNELGVIGSRYASRQEVRSAARMVAAEEVRAVVGATAKLAAVDRLHERLRSGTLIGRGAVLAG